MNRSAAVLTLLALASCALPALAAPELPEAFATAPDAYSPVPIWWWSGDAVEPERIHEQIHLLAQGGIHNAIILNLAPSGPLYGSAADEPPFLSEAWWSLFAVAVEEGKRAGVKIWFYDQFGFSGAGLQARLVRDHPSFRGVTLRREVRDVDGPADVTIETPPGGAALTAFTGQLDDPESKVPCWIWNRDSTGDQATCCFRRNFVVQHLPPDAHCNITCDNGYTLYVNGKELGKELLFDRNGWSRAERYDLRPHLRVGRNTIAIKAEKLGGSAGLLVEVLFPAAKDGESELPPVLSDARFLTKARARGNWTDPGYNDSSWEAAQELGALGIEPWGPIAGIEAAAQAPLGDRLRYVRNVGYHLEDGALHVQVPAGRHRVALYYTVPGGFDYQNPEAGAALIAVVHGEMERRFGDELGKGIAGSFQDEFPAVPRFSNLLPPAFEARMGYSLLDRLPALYDDVVDRFGEPDGPSTIQIRCDANNLAAALSEEAFFAPLDEWHRRFGLLCGYDQTVRNADPRRGEQYYVDYFKTMRHYTAPGNDMDGEAKPHQSMAELYDLPRVWLEGFHSSGWGQTLEETAVLMHPWMADGSTLFDPHAIYYSIHGSYWEWAPPDTGWRQPYYVHYPVLADYSARLCYVLSQGRLVADVGLLHPATTIHAYTGFGQSTAPAHAAADAYWGIQAALRRERLDYVIVDEDSLAAADTDGGVLAMGRARARLMLLPSATVLTGAAVDKLEAFAEGGGLVMVVGDPPARCADGSMTPAEFTARVEALLKQAARVGQPDQVAGAVLHHLPRDLAETLPYTHRRIGDRDFYFVLSDDGTPANGGARRAINSRELWNTSAAQGGRLRFTARVNGIPERWNALTGDILPIWDYARDTDHTRVGVELTASPAPLIAFRPPRAGEPTAIESDLEIVNWVRTKNALTVEAIPRLDTTVETPATHAIRVAFDDAAFETSLPAQTPERIAVEAPFDCRLAPTCDNADGSFAWPPSKGPIPVETRAFRYHTEAPGEDASAFAAPEFDDSAWPTALASYGPRAQWAHVARLDNRDAFDSVVPDAAADALHAAVYSPRLGIDEDPVFSAALGGKGRIPDEFLDLGRVPAGDVYLVRAFVMVPEGVGNLPAVLRVGGVARKRALVNGSEVPLSGDPAARTRRGPITLQEGPNSLELLAVRDTNGPLRLFYQFLPPSGAPPDPEWIWSNRPPESGKTTFTKTFDVTGDVASAEMVVALGGLHQIRMNGELVADQGNFDPYFTSRAERYDIASFLKPDANTIEVEAPDTGHPIGLLLDGRVRLADGTDIVFVSDEKFATAPNEPARILAGPAQGYMGDPANLLLYPRPHPLPEAGWLLGQTPPPVPFDALIYAADTATPPPGWFRFRIPPGATALTFRTPGTASLHVNDMEVALQTEGLAWRAALPDPDAVERVAALRIQSTPGYAEGAALLAPIAFEMGPGRINLGSWDELGLPHYCGGLTYTKDITLPSIPEGARVVLDLGRVRGSADVRVNGGQATTRIWHPYRFDITEDVQPGTNRIDIRIYLTPSAPISPSDTPAPTSSRTTPSRASSAPSPYTYSRESESKSRQLRGHDTLATRYARALAVTIRR